MRVSRFYYPQPLSTSSECVIEGVYHHRLVNVLRLKLNDELLLFNGQHTGDYAAIVTAISKKKVTVTIQQQMPASTESKLNLTLWQSVSRSDRMDYSIQKSVELGVRSIQPLTTERSPFKLKGEKLTKKMAHWGNIIIHACEQSGRCILPVLHEPAELGSLILDPEVAAIPTNNKWFLNPGGKQTLKRLEKPESSQQIIVAIGPEGGFTTDEELICVKAGFKSISVGPRILRTETAASTILSWLQISHGDMG